MEGQATPGASRTRIEPAYLVRTGEMRIRAPLDRVWSHLVNYASWQNFPVVEHISGEMGQEGEVVLLKKVEPGFEFPPYYARTLLKEPLHRIIWKTYPVPSAAPSASEPGFFGIVDFQIDWVGSASEPYTRFAYDILYEFQVAVRDASDLEAFRRLQSENFEPLFRDVLPKLKTLSESNGQRNVDRSAEPVTDGLKR